jgi:hypothetical protein
VVEGRVVLVKGFEFVRDRGARGTFYRFTAYLFSMSCPEATATAWGGGAAGCTMDARGAAGGEVACAAARRSGPGDGGARADDARGGGSEDQGPAGGRELGGCSSAGSIGGGDGASSNITIFLRVRPAARASPRLLLQPADGGVEFNIPRDAVAGCAQRRARIHAAGRPLRPDRPPLRRRAAPA